MVTGFNTNVAYEAKVFHVQTEDCPQQSKIRTVVFDGGSVVAALDCPYSELTGAESPQARHLSQRLESQHWELVRRVKQNGSLSQEVLAGLDQCIEQAQTVPTTFAGIDRVLSEPPTAVVEPTQQRRHLGRWLALGALALLAVGWITPSMVDRANRPDDTPIEPRPVAKLDTAPVKEPALNSVAKAPSVSKPPPPSKQRSAATPPVATRTASPAASSTVPSNTPSVARSTGPTTTSSPAVPTTPAVPATTAASPQVEPPTETPSALPVERSAELRESPPVTSPPTDDTELPAEPTPAIVAQRPAPKVDWTGKLVPLAEVDTTPSTLKRDLPRYTKRAKRKKQQGSVGMKLLIDETGVVSQIELVESIPDSDLNEATIELARHWQFRPATKEGYPVRVWKTLMIDFSIVSGFARVVVKDTGGP